MRAKIFVVLESVFLGLGLLAFTPSVNPTVTGKPRQPFPRECRTKHIPPEIPVLRASRSPLAVWECTTSWYGGISTVSPPQTARPTICIRRNRRSPHFAPRLHCAGGEHRETIVSQICPDQRSRTLRRKDAKLDVSYEVARRLGFDQSGLAKVRLELLRVPTRPEPTHHDD